MAARREDSQRCAAPTAYLDTDLVSALARQHVSADEVNALFSLVELMHQDRIVRLTSAVTPPGES